MSATSSVTPSVSAPISEPGPLRALGILGGTFDPIHVGHLRLAEEAREALGLAGVSFIPAGRPSHRGTPGAAATDRLAMVRLATADNPAFAVDDGEVFSASDSYTVPTLERLRTMLGAQRPLVLILGADAFHGLPSWHRWRDLLQLTHLAVANRPGYAPKGRQWDTALSPELRAACGDHITSDPAVVHTSPAGRIVPFDMTPLAISASQARDLIRSGRSVRYLLPDPVLDYIRLHHLYHGS